MKQVKRLPAALLLLLASTAAAGDLVGAARIIDGDTIELGGQRVRLWGIDAPESRQTCQGQNGDVYECGRDATAVLNELTRGRRVECIERDRDRYKRIVAVCRTETGEINATMVRRGWAVDYTRYSGSRYQPEQRDAKREGLGIWSGRFDMPEDWRRRR
jgi:endonuclease YncB( thermonuclease family)